MIATMMAAAALAADPAPALMPIGKWSIEYHPSMCVLARQFGPPGNPVTFAIRPWTLGTDVEIVVIDAGQVASGGCSGPAVATVEPKQLRLPTSATTVRDRDNVHRITTMSLPRAALAALGRDDILSIRWAYGNLRLQPKGLAAGIAALKTCEDDLTVSWKFDMAELARVVTPAQAVGNMAAFFGTDSYPSAASAAQKSGTSTIAWSIEENGRVGECRVLASAGFPPLDVASCNAVKARGRFKPALDADGKPVRSWQTRRVRWVLG